ncbi:MAG TPA: SAM-dependent methyltransferase [Chitinophagaceae bacterium]|nr:SAM-dependent methyltransferase [Chitinophagaceae bacterium]
MNISKSKIYLIPSLLDDEAPQTIPVYITEAVTDCQVFFVENERTARRFLKKIWKTLPEGTADVVIDNYEWFVMDKAEDSTLPVFKQKIKEGKNIGIISEAGCPGIADPGQALIAIAHQMDVEIKPLVGPSSILLALMASGMNGQRFQFCGYLPIGEQEKIKAIRELEAESQRKDCTQIFIETPYRNNQLIESILKTCKPDTKFCLAVDLTGKNEWIKTKRIAEWKNEGTDIHKRPAIFLLLAQ